MQAFLRGTVQNIRPILYKGKIFVRRLDLKVGREYRLQVNDDRLTHAELLIGNTYNLLVGPSYIMHNITTEPVRDPSLWSAQITQLDWTIPAREFSHVAYRKRPDTDIVLLCAPFGLLMKSHASVYIFTRVPRVDITIGSFISWPKTGHLRLFAIE